MLIYLKLFAYNFNSSSSSKNPYGFSPLTSCRVVTVRTTDMKPDHEASFR